MDCQGRDVAGAVAVSNEPLAYETPETRRDERRERALARGQRLGGWALWSLRLAFGVLALTFVSVCVGLYAALVNGPLWWLGGDGYADLAATLAAVAFVLALLAQVCCVVGFFATGRRRIAAAACALTLTCQVLLFINAMP